MAAAIAAVALLTLLGACAPAERTQGWGPDDAYQRRWNGRAVETLRGTVLSVDRIRPARDMALGAGLHVKTARLVLVVHLGPAWYLDRQDPALAPRDSVAVRGSLVTIGGQLVMIAQRVTRGQAVLRLRDDDGLPRWSAWRRR